MMISITGLTWSVVVVVTGVGESVFELGVGGFFRPFVVFDLSHVVVGAHGEMSQGSVGKLSGGKIATDGTSDELVELGGE